MAKKRRKQRPRRAPAAAAPQAPEAPAARTEAAARRVRKPIEEERPEAPWAPFPLVELLVLVGLGMIVAALFTDGRTSTALLVLGLALGSLAGLELSIREHFGGYRSHTTLLAGAAGVAVIGILFYVVPDALPPAGRLIAGIAAGAVTAFLLARAFRARSGRLVKVR